MNTTETNSIKHNEQTPLSYVMITIKIMKYRRDPITAGTIIKIRFKLKIRN